MTTAQPPLLPEPILFAHRGASAHAPENTVEAFELARRLGATGLESDVWLTADGAAVLDHDGTVGRVRRRRLRDVVRRELPAHVPDLDDIFTIAGPDLHVSLDVCDPAAFPLVADAAVQHRAGSRTWICSADLEALAEVRAGAPTVRLVWSTSTSVLGVRAERSVARLREIGVDALNLHQREWTGGLVALVHRFGRFAFGWDAQFDHVIGNLVRMGLDGIYGDHVDRLVDGARSEPSEP